MAFLKATLAVNRVRKHRTPHSELLLTMAPRVRTRRVLIAAFVCKGGAVQCSSPEGDFSRLGVHRLNLKLQCQRTMENPVRSQDCTRSSYASSYQQLLKLHHYLPEYRTYVCQE